MAFGPTRRPWTVSDPRHSPPAARPHGRLTSTRRGARYSDEVTTSVSEFIRIGTDGAESGIA